MRPPVQSAKDMQRWATILSNELHMRLSLNFDDFGTWPRTLCVNELWETACIPAL